MHNIYDNHNESSAKFECDEQELPNDTPTLTYLVGSHGKIDRNAHLRDFGLYHFPLAIVDHQCFDLLRQVTLSHLNDLRYSLVFTRAGTALFATARGIRNEPGLVEHGCCIGRKRRG